MNIVNKKAENVTFPIELLRNALEACEERLQNGVKSALEQKLQLEQAIKLILFCQQHNIFPTKKTRVIDLPYAGYTNYFILNDNENKDQSRWSVFNDTDGRPLSLICGDKIIIN